MTKVSFLKGIFNFFNEPGIYFIGWKIILFIKQNTLLSAFISVSVILAVVIFVYIIDYILNRFNL